MKCLALMILIAAPALGAAPDPPSPDETRAVLQKWIDTRQLLARTQADWRVEKQSLEQSIRLYQTEIALLQETIEQSEERTSVANQTRTALEVEQSRLQAAAAAAGQHLNQLEELLVSSMKAFPAPLQETIGPLARRIPTPANRDQVGLPERLQNLLGILGEVDKFHHAISLYKEIRKNPEGAEYTMDTLYLGLGQAFFVSPNAAAAGVGYPAGDSWTWEDQPDLAVSIRSAIDIYKNAQPARFVGLPLQVR